MEGDAELVGPDDDHEAVDPSEMAGLRRTVCAAAVGGTADEWAALDEVMDAERHTAVLIRPVRVYSNPPESPA